MLAFGGGHISGALNIGGAPILSIWAGWMLDPEKPILLVMENDDDLERIVRLFVRTGYTKFAGYLIGGMKAWDAAGFPLERIGQMSVHELNDRKDSLQILDVRSPGEWKKGHVPGAQHIFVPEVAKRMAELDRNKPTAIYCGSGYRASIVASTAITASFTMSVVSRICSADRIRAPSSIAAHCKQIPGLVAATNHKPPTTNPPGYYRQDDWTPDYRADDDVSAHVQAESGGELPLRESADVSEVPR